MANVIKHKLSTVAANVPLESELVAGELAINSADGKLFLRKDDATVLEVGSQAVISGNFSLDGALVKEVFTATQGQTTFTPAKNFSTDFVNVYINGIKQIETEDYNADGVDVVLTLGADLNDRIEIVSIFINPVTKKSSTERHTFTATASQTDFIIPNGFTPGQSDVYINGIKLLQTEEYTDDTGTKIVLLVGATLNDRIDVVAYNELEVINNVYGNIVRDKFVATAGQDTFITSINFASTYVDVAVFVNGIRLIDVDDYDSTSGSQIVTTSTLNLNDDVEVVLTTYTEPDVFHITREYFTATAGQTDFNFTYIPKQVEVYLNGLKMRHIIDVDVTSGTIVSFTSGLNIGDEVDVIAYQDYALIDVYTQTEVNTALSLKADKDLSNVVMTDTVTALQYTLSIANGAIVLTEV